FATAIAVRAAADDRCGSAAPCPAAKECLAADPARFAVAAGFVAHAVARALRSALVATAARRWRAVRSGGTVRRCAALGRAGYRGGGTRVLALQHAVVPREVRRHAASDEAPWPDVVAGEPHGRRARPVLPLPEVPKGEPSRVAPPDVPSQAARRVGPRLGLCAP